jgi:predicted CoA-substrate-specific enzyme activase
LLGEVMLGADRARNEITAHARAALHFCPEVQTIIEIGGQDSKIILLRQGYPVDFAMNSACAAGTGSFLEQQARRLQIPLDDFGDWAARAEKAAPLAGRCVVFAETDMIHKQQLGIPKEEIVRGLCHALVRNYLHGVARGKEIAAPILFQGGVAANEAIRHALIEALGHDVMVPPQHQAMGAIGAALLVAEDPPPTSSFRGFHAIAHASFRVEGHLCDGCQEQCEIVRYYAQDQLVASYGNRCEVGAKPDKNEPDVL